MSYPSSENKSQKNLLIGAGVLIAILVGVIIFLLVNKQQQATTISNQKTELADAATLQKELEAEYDEAMAELDQALAENESLRDAIEEQKEELANQKAKISRIISQGKQSDKRLKDARDEIDSLIARQKEFLAEIEQLKSDNALKGEQIAVLEGEKEIMQGEVQKEREASEKLEAEKEELITENTEKEEKITELEDKVLLGSVVKTNNIKVTGYKTRSSGKRVSKRYAKNIELLEICYNTVVNDLAAAGTEVYHVRLISPLGETLYQESLGSGEITNKSNSEPVRYSTVNEVEYNKDAAEHCLTWQPGIPFQKGKYIVELYNKGYLAGKASFTLK